MFVQLQKEFLGRKPGERIDVSESDANALTAQQLATPVTRYARSNRPERVDKSPAELLTGHFSS